MIEAFTGSVFVQHLMFYLPQEISYKLLEAPVGLLTKLCITIESPVKLLQPNKLLSSIG